MQEMTELRRWLIALSVVFVAVVEVLDMTIVNVALPTMMGTLSATTDQITWVLTSYIVSAAIFMPLTGFLIGRLGVKKLLLLNIVGFLLSSMLCGLSTSLTEMVLFRIFQGIFGASLIPISQFVLRNTFPPEQMTKAMALWGVGIMAGPVLGPTIGGYITEILNWRWIFYLNVPVCIIAFFLCWRLIEETETQQTSTDWLGIILMSTAVGAFQLFLDRGNSDDWFSTPSIQWLFITFILSFTVFMVRGMRIKHNIINLHLFTNKNFSVGCSVLAIFCASIFGLLALQPLLMENLMNYSTELSGLIMAPRGFASAFAMALVPMLSKRFDPRLIISTGIIFCCIGTYEMTHFNLAMSPWPFIWTGAIQGVGMGLFFAPLSNLTFSTLPRAEYAEAAGLFGFWRSIGQSIGVSLLSTLISREQQINWHTLNSHVQNFNPGLHYWLASQHSTLQNPVTLQQLVTQVAHQAGIISFIDAFHLITICLLFMLPLIALMENKTLS